MKKAIVIVLCILFILSLTSCGGDAWPTTGLGAMLPKPSSGTVKIHFNDDNFYATVDKAKPDEFANYISACEKLGYTVDAEKKETSYDAYNKDGYHLDLTSFSSSNDIMIKLDPPIEMGTLRWPSGEMGKLIPQPDSKTGKTQYENDGSFLLYIGDTTLDQFDEYADKCAQAGFNVEYERGDKYYQANSKNGYHLYLKYEGFNIMSIDVSKIDDEIQDTDTKEKNKDSDSTNSSSSSKSVSSAEDKTVSSADNENTADSSEIRTDIKDAIDSYEIFVDEYCSFMESYDSSDMQQLAKYTSLVAKELEMANNFKALENQDLTDAETSYYLEVQLRCNEKLLSVANKIN